MLRSYPRHSHRFPYGLHRFHRMRPRAIRYSRSRLPYPPMMMRRPVFYPRSVPVQQPGFFSGILAMLAALFCLKRQQTGRRAITSGGNDINITSGGGSCGAGGSCGGGSGNSSSCGGGGGSCGGGGGGGSCGGS